MQKEINPYYIVKNNENIDIVAKNCNKNSVSILVKNQILPKNVKEGVVLYIKN